MLVNGTHVFDGTLNELGTIAGPWPDVGALDATGTLAYRQWRGMVQTVDVAALAVVWNHELGDTTLFAQDGTVIVSPDGRRVVAITEHGICVVDV